MKSALWIVICTRVTTGETMPCEIVSGVPWRMSEKEADEMAKRINAVGRYHAEVRRAGC